MPGKLVLTYAILTFKVIQTYATSTSSNRGALTQLVSKSTKLLSSLAMFNNKTTNTKLESTNYLATQTKQISYARELLLCYTSKKVTSKLHKQTNYKSNYTITMYRK